MESRAEEASSPLTLTRAPIPFLRALLLMTSSSSDYLSLRDATSSYHHTGTLYTFCWCLVMKFLSSNIKTEGFSSDILRRDCVFYTPDVHTWNACNIGSSQVWTMGQCNELLLFKVSVSLYNEGNESSGKMLMKYLQSFHNLILMHKLIRKSYKAIYRCSVETLRTEMVADAFIMHFLGQTFGPHNIPMKKILLWSPKCMWGTWSTAKISNLCSHRAAGWNSGFIPKEFVLEVYSILHCLVAQHLSYTMLCIISYMLYLMLCYF